MRTRSRIPAAFALGTLLTGLIFAVPAPTLAAASDLVVTGVVQRQEEAAAATIGKGAVRGVSGASVRLMWDEQPAQAKGEEGALTTVASATTDASGGYELRLSPSAAMAQAAASNDGWVNFRLISSTAEGFFTFRSLSRALVDGAWSDKGRPEYAPGKRVVTTFAFDADGKLLSGGRSTLSDGAVLGEPGCPYTVAAVYNASTRIGNFHNTVGIYGWWQYGETADSDIDLGIKYTGEGWGVDGSTHVGNSGGAWERHATTHSYDKYVRTNFQYHLRHFTHCGTATIDVYTMVAIRWTGGGQDDGNTYRNCHSLPYANYQDLESAGSTLHIYTSRATRIGFVIDVAGVHLGGTSGYSTEVQMHWDIHEDRLFCGYRDYPVGRDPGPGVIYNQVS